jgi:hypothetical protein
MFGSNKRIYERQLRRALLISNAVRVGLFAYHANLLGYEPKEEPNDRTGIIAAAINYMFGNDFDKSIETFIDKEKTKKLVCSKADEILKSDPDLEALIHRILYDIGSLCIMLKDDKYAQQIRAEHPRLMEIVTENGNRSPEKFKDYNEEQFKKLISKYADKYDPKMKDHLLKLF